MRHENPKTEYLTKRQKTLAVFPEPQSPLVEEIKDVEKARFLSEWPVIPFLGNSNTSLRVLKKLRDLSPSHGGCIGSIRDYALGGGFSLVERTMPGFSTGMKKEASEGDKEKFFLFLEDAGINSGDLYSEAEALYDNYKETGNSYIEVRLVSTLGKKEVSIKSLDSERCLYLATYPGEPKIMMISPSWKLEYVNKYPPRSVAVYPNFSEDENGDLVTIIHTKNKRTGRDWYGIPDSFSSLWYQYVEHQQGHHTSKGFAKSFSGKHFIETASADELTPEEEYEARQMIDAMFTYEGSGASVMMRNRSVADEETNVYSFPSNTSEGYETAIKEISEQMIVRSHQWHIALLGESAAGVLGNSQQYLNILKAMDVTTLARVREKVERPLNTALKIAGEFLGNDPGATLSFSSLISQLENDGSDNNGL
jgi:hypothetical protein